MKTSTWPSLLVLGIALLSALSALAGFAGAQQVRPKIAPPDFTREWELDVSGLRQWKAFDVECTHCKGVKSHICDHCKETKFAICLECDGSKRAPCRTCGGVGKLPDPLKELICPYCDGSSWLACGQCNSFGVMTIDGAETKCGACKAKGLLKCSACAGKRRVEGARFGKQNVGEVGSKELKEYLPKLKATLAAMEKFEPESNPSKSAKAFAKILEPVERELKAFKDVNKALDESLKGIKSFGAAYSGFEERLLTQFLNFKDRSVFLLQHQIRAAEQSLERAEFNETKGSR